MKIKIVLSLIIVFFLVSGCFFLFDDVSIQYPEDGDYVNESVIYPDIFQGADTDYIRVYRGYTEIYPNYSGEYAVTVNQYGSTNISVDAYDYEGSYLDSDSVTFYYDNEDPELTFNQYQRVGETIVLSGRADDNYEVNELSYRHLTNSAITGDIYVSSYGGTWSLQLKNLNYSSVQQTVQFTIEDGAGNSISKNAVFVFGDVISPLLNIISPADNSIVDGTFEITGNTSDNYGLKLFEYKIDSGDFLDIRNQLDVYGNWNIQETLTTGTYIFTFVAIDHYDNQTVQTLMVMIL